LVIESETKSQRIRFSLLERATERLPSRKVQIEVVLDDFSGRSSAWIDDHNFENFRLELRQVEATRNGEASVASMSPGDFQLSLKNTDRLGHFLVEVKISKHLTNPIQRIQLTGGFPIDPSVLPETYASLDRFLKDRH
jgi:hypothetical protein